MRLKCDVDHEWINDTDNLNCTEPLPLFVTIEHICNAWFTFELTVRLIVSIYPHFHVFILFKQSYSRKQ